MIEDENKIKIKHPNKDLEIIVECSEKHGGIILSNPDSFYVMTNSNGELDIFNKKRENSKWSVFRCPVCKKYFIKRYTEKTHLVQCVSQKDNLTEEFKKSDFGALDIKYSRNPISYSVIEFLEDHKDEYKGEGVWALWHNDICIQVAKTQNIYKEIYDDFENNKGSINYSEYKKGGKIVIVSDKSSFEIEAKYAFDNDAQCWRINRRKDINGKPSEWNQIKNLLNTSYFDENN